MEQNVTSVEQMIRSGRSIEDVLAMVAAEAKSVQAQIEAEREAKEKNGVKAKARLAAATALMDYLEVLGVITPEDRERFPDEVVANECLVELEQRIAEYGNLMKRLDARFIEPFGEMPRVNEKEVNVEEFLKQFAKSLK